jgi:hypothetical protein
MGGRVVSFAYRGDPKYLGQPTDGLTNGCAYIDGPYRKLTIIFSDGLGWEHVSVSTPNRVPNWAEMCFVKNLFWSPDDVVVQFHPARSEYVNDHPFCLHLWRPCGRSFPSPPSVLVGYRRRGEP